MAHSKKSYPEYARAQYLGRYYLTVAYVICFSLGRIEYQKLSVRQHIIYVTGKILKSFNTLEDGLPNLFKRFPGNKLKVNASKSHLQTESGENKHVNVGTSRIKNKSCERLT